jgi:hypothetical protein
LFRAQADSTHRYVVPAQDSAYRLPVDLEQVAQFVYGCPGLVASDELLDLVGLEMLYMAWFALFRSRCPLAGRWR